MPEMIEPAARNEVDSEAPLGPMAPFWQRPSWLWWAMLVLICTVGLAVRLYDLAQPLLDFHPTRQLHAALIARGIYYEGRGDLPEWQREMAVRQWRSEGVIEPQVFERLAAWTYARIGSVDLRAPRLYAVLFWTIAALFLVLLAIEMAGWAGALAAALFFLLWPYGVTASRAFQPEPLLLALMAAAVWAALRWARRPTWGWTIAAGLLAGLALYVKVVAVFFLGPALAVLALSRGGPRRAVRDPRAWALAVLALLPYAAYHIDGVYLQGYLAGQFSQRFFPEMWLDPAFYLRWISNLERVIPFGLLLVGLLGAWMTRRPLHRALLLAMWVGYFLYGMALSHHISTHDYYHLLLFPQVALGLGAAAEVLLRALRGPRRGAQAAVTLALVALLAVYGYQARNTIKRSDAAAQAQALAALGQELGPNSAVVALVTDYGAGLKYYAWLMPVIWPTAADIRFQQESGGLEYNFSAYFENQAAGRDFFVISPLDELERQPELKELLYARYPVYQQSAELLVFDLRGP